MGDSGRKKGSFWDEAISEKIKYPYAFISYCHENKSTYTKVQKLARHLEKSNINVVYDKGGLQPGENLDKFIKLLNGKNCKYILVICDACYTKKAKKNIGGVGAEYSLIGKIVKKKKVIPVTISGNNLPLFEKSIYINFDQIDSFELIEKALSELRMTAVDGIDSLKSLLKKADELHETKDYKSALTKINEAEKKFYNKATNKEKIDILNLKLVILMGLGKEEKYEVVLKALLECLDETDIARKAPFYLNCALAYSGLGQRNNAISMSVKARKLAMKEERKDLYNYSLTVANSYFEDEQYSNAIKYGMASEREFSKLYKQDKIKNKALKYDFIKIEANCAEYLYTREKNIDSTRSEKEKNLNSARKRIMDALLCCRTIIDVPDCFCAELYRISGNVFLMLYEHYRH